MRNNLFYILSSLFCIIFFKTSFTQTFEIDDWENSMFDNSKLNQPNNSPIMDGNIVNEEEVQIVRIDIKGKNNNDWFNIKYLENLTENNAPKINGQHYIIEYKSDTHYCIKVRIKVNGTTSNSGVSYEKIVPFSPTEGEYRQLYIDLTTLTERGTNNRLPLPFDLLHKGQAQVDFIMQAGFQENDSISDGTIYIKSIKIGAEITSTPILIPIPTYVTYIDNKPVMQRNGDNILFAGIQYWGLDTWNENNWDNDISEIKALGLNGIRLNIGWDHIETAENQFDFSKLDTLLNKIDDANLMVYLQFNQSAHNWKPQWFIDKYGEEDLYAYDVNGAKQYTRFSFASPYFEQYYTRYILNTIEHIKNRRCIVAYSIYTEPHFKDGIDGQWMDYSQHNKEKFKEWLKEKYSDIDELNTAWEMSFNSFQNIYPIAKAPDTNWEDLGDHKKKKFEDWREWNCIVKAKFIGNIIKQAKQVDSLHLYGQNMMWKWTNGNISIVSLEPEINYEYADIIGINTYPLSKNANKIGDQVNFIQTLHNNEKIVWLGEFNNKKGNATQTDLQNFAKEAFDAGCSGFVYFTYNGNADGGIEHYGIVLDGDRKPSWYDLQSFMNNETIGNEQDILNTPLPNTRAYFLWTKTTPILTYHDREYSFEAYQTLRDLLYYQNDMSVAALTEQRFLDGNFSKNIPLIIPSLPFIDPEINKKLETYIKDDGSSVFIAGRYAEYLQPKTNESTYLGYPRTISEIELTLDEKSEDVPTIDVTKDFYYINTNDQLVQPEKDKIVITPRNKDEVIATWGNSDTAAIVAQAIGSGKVMYYGTHFLHSDNEKDFASRLLKSFIEWSEESVAPTKYNLGEAMAENYIEKYQEEDCIVYPVPVSDILHIKTKHKGTAEFYNSNGKKVKESIIQEGINDINLTGLKSATYILNVKYNTKIKQHIIVKQ